MKSRGDDYEERAARWLVARGVQLLERNFRAATGEIDIIARDGGALVFVEVRARCNPRFAGAAASVTPAKQRRIVRTAQLFLKLRPALARLPCRFDVLAFEPPQSGTDSRVRWVRGAFTA